jgi:hypothetical protein
MEVYFKKSIRSSDIPENEATKKLWDLNENKNFTILNGYKIRNDITNGEAASYYFYMIDIYIKELGQYILNNINLAKNRKCFDECIIFLNTPYTIQELSKNSYYNGLNKPKNIQWKKKDCPYNTMLDNNFLASYRLIMLKIREKNGMLIPWKGIEGVKSLILHELAHTCCNHVTYREEGNHKKEDFEKCNKFLIFMANKSENCKKTEKKINTLIKNEK